MIKCRANDVIGNGVLEITYNNGTPCPLGLEFKREPIEEFPYYECAFNMSPHEAKKLAMYILENL